MCQDRKHKIIPILAALSLACLLFFAVVISSFAQSSYVSIKDVTLSPSRITAGPKASVTVSAKVSGVYGVQSASAELRKGNSRLASISLTQKSPDSEEWSGTFFLPTLSLGPYTVIVIAQSKRKGVQSVVSAPQQFEVILPPPAPQTREASQSVKQRTAENNKSLVVPELEEKISQAKVTVQARKQVEEKIRAQAQPAFRRIERKLRKKESTYRPAAATIVPINVPSIEITQGPTMFLANGPSTEQLDIVFLGLANENFPIAELRSLTDTIIGRGFQMYTPFRNNWSRMNFDVAIARNNLFSSNDGEKKKRNRARDAAYILKEEYPWIDEVIVLSKDAFTSFASLNNHQSFVSLKLPFNITGKTEYLITDTQSKLNLVVTQVMHEFGHSFGGLADEHTSESSSGHLSVNCKDPINVPSFWVQNQGVLDWSYSQEGKVAVTAGVYDGCGGGGGKENKRPTDSSIMTGIVFFNMFGDTGFSVFGWDFPHYGYVSIGRLTQRMEGYSLQYTNDACGALGQWACGITNRSKPNGRYCYDGLKLSQETRGNICQAQCGESNQIACQNASFGVACNNHLRFDKKTGLCLPCGKDLLWSCPLDREHPEVYDGGCLANHENSNFKDFVNCSDLPSNEEKSSCTNKLIESLLDGSCLPCGGKNQIICKYAHIEKEKFSHGCRVEFVRGTQFMCASDDASCISFYCKKDENPPSSQLGRCERMACVACPSGTISDGNGSCISISVEGVVGDEPLCGYANMQACTKNPHGSYNGCFPKVVNRSGTCLACDTTTVYTSGKCITCGRMYGQSSPQPACDALTQTGQVDGCYAPFINTNGYCKCAPPNEYRDGGCALPQPPQPPRKGGGKGKPGTRPIGG